MFRRDPIFPFPHFPFPNQLNSVDQVYTRDELNRMKQRDLKRVNETLPFSKEIYRYDDLMNRLTSIDREDSKRDAFKYDFSGQLSTADYGLIYDGTHWVNPQRPVGYVWDKAGNRQSVTDTGATSNYTTTNLNQYTFAGADAVYNGTEHEISNYQGKTYGYINDERLSSITSANDSYQLAYDALGRCVRRTLNGVVSYYAYDGEKPILEYNNVYQIVAKNVYGKAIDEVLMRTDYTVTPNATFYYQDDHEGSVTHLTDDNGNVIESYRYDAFGAPTIFNQSAIAIPQSALGNRFMFTGREYAQKFGIYEYRARAYHPGLGRFTSEDPMGYAAGDYNLFRYCGNDPEDRTDPTGLVAAPRDTDMRLPDWSQKMAQNERYFQVSVDAHSVEMHNYSRAEAKAAGQGSGPTLSGRALGGAGPRSIAYLIYGGKWTERDAKDFKQLWAENEEKFTDLVGDNIEHIIMPDHDGGFNITNLVPQSRWQWLMGGMGRPASEKTAKDIAKQIEHDLGKEARREFHDMKQSGSGDRTLQELKAHARAIYENEGKVPPPWLR